MKKILQKNEKILRRIATEVPVGDIKKTKIQKILKEMSESLAGESDGVAIAAPQIGYSLRIFVVSNKILHADFPGRGVSQGDGPRGSAGSAEPDSDPVQEESAVQDTMQDLIFINPKILKLSRAKEWMPEGCLSVRPVYGKTFRSIKATIEAYDENGNKFTRGGAGLLAQIFQHETDHLNGILFIDHAKELKEEVPK